MTYSLNKKSLLKEKTTIIIIVFQTCVYEMSHLWDPDIPKHWWVGWSFNPGTTRTSLLSTLPPWRWHLHQGPCCSSAHVVTKKLWNNWSVWQYKWQYKFDTIGMLTVDLKKNPVSHYSTEFLSLSTDFFPHVFFFAYLSSLPRPFFPTQHRAPAIASFMRSSTLAVSGQAWEREGRLQTYSTKNHLPYPVCLSSWWFQPHLKNVSQNGNLPQTGVNIQNIWNNQSAMYIYIYLPPYIYHKKSTKCRYKYQTSILRDLTNSETDSLWDWLFVKVHPASWIRILMICFSLKVIPTNRSCIVRFWGGNLAQGILKVQGFKFSESIQLLRSVTVPWGSYRVPMDSILTDFQQ